MTLLENFDTDILVDMAYIFSAMLFIFGLKMLGSPKTARKGNLLSSVGMLSAVLVTLLDQSIIDFTWIISGMLLGASIGYFAATLVKMTSMPEMVALFNGFGGIASLLVGSAEYLNNIDLNLALLVAIYLTVLIGGVTFTGSLIAWSKLSEIINGRPFLYKGQKIVNSLLLFLLLIAGAEMIYFQGLFTENLFQILGLICLLAFILGVLFVVPIGGADMPVVIALQAEQYVVRRWELNDRQSHDSKYDCSEYQI